MAEPSLPELEAERDRLYAHRALYHRWRGSVGGGGVSLYLLIPSGNT
jgi:hypothetical protein